MASIIGVARAPTAAAAVPKNTENTTICRISLRAMPSTIEVGTRWVMKSFIVRPVVVMPASVPTGGIMPAANSASPGRNRFTRIRPSDSEMSEAMKNQPSALTPMRPTSLASPILAMPTTRVANTSGAMIILIRRRNSVVINDIVSAKLCAPAVSVLVLTR